MGSWVEHLDARTNRLYEAIRGDPKNQELIAAVEDGPETPVDLEVRADGITIVLVPGIFYRDYPHTGADGAALKKIAAELGLPVVMIPLDGTEGRKFAAATICEWLRTRIDSPGPIILVSLSIGSTEVACALSHSENLSAFDRVAAWISVSGLPLGTPTLEYALRNPIRNILLRTLCALKRWDLAVIRDLLAHRPSLTLMIPPHLTFLQATPFPLRSHLTDRRSRRFQKQLASLGPSDGFVLLEEVTRLPGLIYPLWGADHYLNGLDDLDTRIAKLMRFVLHRVSKVEPLNVDGAQARR